MPIRVLIADDHGIIRDGIRSLLSMDTGIEVVGAAENGRQAVELVAKLHPDIVLMDVSMPDLNGIEATSQITRDNPETKVLALSTYSDHRYVREMLNAGASGYLLKDSVYDDLRSAIQALQSDKSYLSPAVAHVVLADYRQAGSRQAHDEGTADKSILTQREREVLQLLAEGHTMKDVASRLSISVKTVETHRKQLSDKLGLRTIVDLTKYAIREGITSVEP